MDVVYQNMASGFLGGIFIIFIWINVEIYKYLDKDK